jgi:hypothetical protein
MLDAVPFTCLYNVAFVPKGARKPRERFFCKENLRIPVIEILIPVTVKVPLARIHLDALYRRLVHEAKYAGSGIFSPIAAVTDPMSADFRDRVMSSVRRSWDDPALSSSRLALLEEAQRLRFGGQQLLKGIDHLSLRSDLSDEVKTPLDPPDEAAIAWLA